jgi:succinate dehydrogenase / fumarate reductase flavoprotein subunit
LSDLLVFGRRAGAGAAEYVRALESRPTVSEDTVTEARATALKPFQQEGGENPYTLHMELQQSMNDLVGIIRRENELADALVRLTELRERVAKVSAAGGRRYNPGWHLALDLRNMLLVSECVAKAALLRTESRGGHTRDDHPSMDAEWRRKLLVCNVDENGVSVEEKPQIPIRHDLLDLFDRSELEKYLTAEELS